MPPTQDDAQAPRRAPDVGAAPPDHDFAADNGPGVAGRTGRPPRRAMPIFILVVVILGALGVVELVHRQSADAGAKSDGNAELQAAYLLLDSNLNISTDLFGKPEPGLASFVVQGDSVCHLRCGYHLFTGAGVDDAEIEFSLADLDAKDGAITAQKDGLGRAIVSFQSRDASNLFRRRDREMADEGKPPLPWGDWREVSKGYCRAVPDEAILQRVVDALQFLAIACGAKESPF